MINLRTGVDLIEINRLRDLKPEIRKRFLERVFTPLELSQAGQSDARLAGRFAAKEAVAKALGTGIGQIRWKDIEVENDESGAPQLRLLGNAEQIAREMNLNVWSISISHSKTHAVAIAVALSSLEGQNLE